jgi:myo-inositol-1(or 4)-monophosphatase
MSPELTSSDLQTILLSTVALARTAGALILEGSEVIQPASSKESDIFEKNCPVDLVTEYDVKVEQIVKREIQAAFPEFKL